MASSKVVVSTNPDLPRDSSISPLSSLLLSDLHHSTSMDDLLKSITPSAAKTVDDVWKEIVAGAHPHHPAGTVSGDRNAATVNATATAPEGYEAITLEDFLTKAGAVREEDVRGVLPPSSSLPFPLPLPAEGSSSSVEPFGNGVAPTNSVPKGKRRVVEEPVDKATLQKQRRMIKNRESAARSRERKQAYTSELEYLVHQLEQENARLINEEAEMRRQRKKQVCNGYALF
ncbi:protein ABSCISIC ACID-INSENSITIVE 5 isoform X2 [Vigna radiata var. radiata]|uniref:Protein ABSCISIC ACID-INSENSITIVE 5 isoform X2 n=1 Tax=Vigna radiata var. radiata TaxID=3916 RepID=A0A1S3T8G5_VIGRR|nr:protein ABSCISIC ACID-INSENSITIVE 5 isoform X2 [Vigna radiata var. radiata]